MIASNALRRRLHPTRRGTVTVLAAVMAIVMLGLVAFAVDVGYVLSNKQELQRTADSAALAACWEFGRSVATGSTASTAITQGRNAAAAFAQANPVGTINPAVEQNIANSETGDVVFGHIDDFFNPSAALSTASPDTYNAVRVKVRRDGTLNGETPYFFARVFGRQGQALEAEATAGFLRNIRGFHAPNDGENLDLLPFALDVQTWNDLVAGRTGDAYHWNSSTSAITNGADGVREVNLYPQGTGSPGNRGTVDIGGRNNSTADIARQILHGISADDMAQLGGTLEFDENGELELNGDTGISAGVKDELAAIKGEPRIIPIFSKVVGPGNNAQYTIVHWAGVRIMAVRLTGAMSQKHLIVQPCPMVVRGAIPSDEQTSDYVYSPVILVR